MLQVCIESLGCANIERTGYLFYQGLGKNICFGKFKEQGNDAGEYQYVFEIDNSVLTEDILDDIVLPGIDLTQRRDVYIRSYVMPYFVECSTIQDGREDLKEYLGFAHMDYNDRFEFMLRTRAITHHTNCYLGRFSTDFEDAKRIMDDPLGYAKQVLPNLNVQPENEWHEIDYHVIDYLK